MGGGFWFLVFAIGISSLIATIVPLVYKNTITNFGSFYEYNKNHYERTVELLKEGVPAQFSDPAWFDAANLKQIETFGDALIDTRNKIVDFNKGLYHYHTWQNSFWDGILRPNVPEGITYIER